MAENRSSEGGETFPPKIEISEALFNECIDVSFARIRKLNKHIANALLLTEILGPDAEDRWNSQAADKGWRKGILSQVAKFETKSPEVISLRIFEKLEPKIRKEIVEYVFHGNFDNPTDLDKAEKRWNAFSDDKKAEWIKIILEKLNSPQKQPAKKTRKKSDPDVVNKNWGGKDPSNKYGINLTDVKDGGVELGADPEPVIAATAPPVEVTPAPVTSPVEIAAVAPETAPVVPEVVTGPGPTTEPIPAPAQPIEQQAQKKKGTWAGWFGSGAKKTAKYGAVGVATGAGLSVAGAMAFIWKAGWYALDAPFHWVTEGKFRKFWRHSHHSKEDR